MLDQSKLLLDVGNTSIKYAWFGNQNIADLQVLRTSIDSLPDLLSQASHCFFCSVKALPFNQTIVQMCKQEGLRLTHVETKSSEFGLTNAYNTPNNMGTDRWMAIVAGAALCDQGQLNNYVVIDAGTAITCDFVINNEHHGGWIAPGLQMARESVVAKTSRVFDDTQLLDTLMLGKDTPECVANGALAQLSGMLMQAVFMMRKRCKKFEIYISGGDAPILIRSLNQLDNLQCPVSINYLENLVLVGLAKIAQEKTTKTA